MAFDGTRNVFARTPFIRGDFTTGTFAIRVRYVPLAGAHPDAQAIFGGEYGGGTAGTQFFIGKHASDSYIGLQDGQWIGTFSPSSNLYDQAFHTLVATIASDVWTFYLDGVQINQRAISPSTRNALEHILIGHEAEATGYTWTGEMSAVAFYSRAVTEAEAKDLHAAFACDNENAEVLLDVGASGLSGDKLNVVVLSSSTKYASPVALRFRGAANAAVCDTTTGVGAGGSLVDDGVWTHVREAAGCYDVHTSQFDLTTALANCGFARSTDGDETVFEAVLEATTVTSTGAIYGQPTTRTDVTAFRVQVRYPNAVEVATDSSATVYGSQITFAAVSSQTVDSTDREFVWTLATSVQYPYYLQERATTTNTPAGFSTALPIGDGGDCLNNAGVCSQSFAITGTPTAGVCTLDGTVTMTFDILCRPNLDIECSSPVPGTQAVTFTYKAANFCPQVVEVGSVTPTLKTYSDAPGGVEARDFILGSMVYARVALTFEGAITTSAVDLTDVTVTSACQGTCTTLRTPLANSAGVDTLNDWLVTNGLGAGQPWADFSFRLNTAAINFDDGAESGNAVVTLYARVKITYTEAASQEEKVRYVDVEATGPALASSASTQFGTASSPSSGASSSTAGSTVLGVSAGTAMIAVVGLAAVAAVAAGAVVVKRRRQSSSPSSSSSAAAQQVKHSSSSANVLELGGAPSPMPTENLQNVQQAYNQVQV